MPVQAAIFPVRILPVISLTNVSRCVGFVDLADGVWVETDAVGLHFQLMA